MAKGFQQGTAMYLIAVVWFLLSCIQFAPAQRQWVFLQKKARPQTVTPSALGISQRALERRAKILPRQQLIDEYDYPVSREAVEQIQSTGARIHSVSRWLNAISVDATPAQLTMLRGSGQVSLIRPVVSSKHPAPYSNVRSQQVTGKLSSKSLGTSTADLPLYGQSTTQIAFINAIDLHTLGITGNNIIVGMLDDGFNNHATHAALKNIKVIADSDLVQKDNNTSRSPGEYRTQGNHGAGTLSEIGGYDPGKLIGAAYGASFILAKTEIDSIEVQVEEDNYVAGLEWMERLGVDITSTSLGYDDFDPTGRYPIGNGIYDSIDIVYNMKNGRTAITSRAASIAARKGVLMVVAIGNDYWAKTDTIIHYDTLGHITSIVWGSKPGTGSLETPADADSIITVGATETSGVLASFSSTGPTSDGRTKPEVSTQGADIYWADGTTTNGYSIVEGTSCSTPLVAGAAALILSAHPNLQPMQVREAILATAKQSNDGTSKTSIYPNNYYGYGLVDAYAAALYFGPVFGNVPSISVIDPTHCKVRTMIASKSGLVNDSLFFYFRFNSTDVFSRTILTSTTTPDQYSAIIPQPSAGDTVMGYFYAREQSGKTNTFPFNAPSSTFSFVTTNNSTPSIFSLYQNYPNPFNNSTTFVFDVPRENTIEIAIYNLLGQRVKTILSRATPAGRYSIRWDGTNEKGQTVASGIYFYTLKSQDIFFSKKMLFLK